ncbi:hypothetical protein [Paenibacillus glycinis]|uniref:Uncharacterized protein n=1 Tax=Paenibacillus glycinis TaxID=2697035 RepID=A0ABW9XYB3_9BACL|nr:hypothetical protein [Paenibacillus glycinis]NBD27712.1 hypothetical protein [Paenibacillus glycinis]
MSTKNLVSPSVLPASALFVWIIVDLFLLPSAPLLLPAYLSKKLSPKSFIIAKWNGFPAAVDRQTDHSLLVTPLCAE